MSIKMSISTKKQQLITFLIFAIFAFDAVTAGKTRQRNQNSDDNSTTGDYVKMYHYEACKIGQTNMVFENLTVLHDGADQNVRVVYNLTIKKTMKSPIICKITIIGKKEEKSMMEIPFYTTTMKDLCPHMEKEGTMKEVMSWFGFVNQTCPIQEGFYDRTNNPSFKIPKTGQDIMSCNDFWKISIEMEDENKFCLLCLNMYFKKVYQQTKTKTNKFG